jgi:hypothetical protein
VIPAFFKLKTLEEKNMKKDLIAQLQNLNDLTGYLYKQQIRWDKLQEESDDLFGLIETLQKQRDELSEFIKTKDSIKKKFLEFYSKKHGMHPLSAENEWKRDCEYNDYLIKESKKDFPLTKKEDSIILE